MVEDGTEAVVALWKRKKSAAPGAVNTEVPSNGKDVVERRYKNTSHEEIFYINWKKELTVSHSNANEKKNEDVTYAWDPGVVI